MPLSTREPYRLLMVGNSYLMFNNLSGMLERMAAADPNAARSLTTRLVAWGGWTMQRHWEEGPAQQEITAGNHHTLLLQGHSTEAIPGTVHPLQGPNGQRVPFLTYGRLLRDAALDAGLNIVLMVTWPRRFPHAFYEGHPAYPTPHAALDAITEGYRLLADAHPAITLVPVGEAWLTACDTLDVADQFYMPDGHHPRCAGSYLAACVLYQSLGLGPCKNAWYPEELTADLAGQLQQIATQTHQAARC